MDSPSYNTVEHINQIFPNEQSLVGIDVVISKMQIECVVINESIHSLVCKKTSTGLDGRNIFNEAQKFINNLQTQIIEIRSHAEKTEKIVRRITSAIAQYDCAKKNIISATITLNHLHILVDGIHSLKKLSEKRLYGEILNPLQAISDICQNFRQYNNILKIRNLLETVDQLLLFLTNQITKDFKEVFLNNTKRKSSSNRLLPFSQLSEACKILSILDPNVKTRLLKWLTQHQLEEYGQLFYENQDTAWLDKIDSRYAWLQGHLVDFEQKFGAIFPLDWAVSERIAVQFCHRTRNDLSCTISKHLNKIDVGLLLFAVNKTQEFEQLLSTKFTGTTISDGQEAVNFNKSSGNQNGIFHDIIGECFKPHLNIYTNTIDQNLAELIERFKKTSKESLREPNTSLLPSSGDLFTFYKKCIVQCSQLNNDQSMYELTIIFKKYLREYANKILEPSIPQIQKLKNSTGTSVSLFTRDLQSPSLAAGKVLNNLIKDNEGQLLTKADLREVCCILTTADYCFETVQQLEAKLIEKLAPVYVHKADMSKEKQLFDGVISNCIRVMVQNLEIECDASLTAMSKVQWQIIRNVGDQSFYINTIIEHFKKFIPTIRQSLVTSKKYFAQFCNKLVSSFILRFFRALYKCRPITVDGSINILSCEQLLLDTYILKTALLELPSFGSRVDQKAPTCYTKIVLRDMNRAEMIIKVIMIPITSNEVFTERTLQLIPDLTIAEYQNILDMKSVKRSDALQLIEVFKRITSSKKSVPVSGTIEEYSDLGNGTLITSKLQ